MNLTLISAKYGQYGPLREEIEHRRTGVEAGVFCPEGPLKNIRMSLAPGFTTFARLVGAMMMRKWAAACSSSFDVRRDSDKIVAFVTKRVSWSNQRQTTLDSIDCNSYDLSLQAESSV